MKIIKPVSILVTLLLYSISLPAQNFEMQLTEEVRSSVLNSLKEQILENYVIEEVSKQIHDSLTNKEAIGGYNEIVSHEEFVDQLELDLRKWSNDLHFKIWYTGIPPDTKLLLLQPIIPKMEILDGDIAYLYDIQKLSNHNIDVFKDLINQLHDAKALIIDLRKCSGGDRKAIKTLSSNFFKNSIHLVSYEFRGRKTEIEKTRRKKKSGELHRIPIYILTSEKTASGGESFAYLMKHHGRAKIIGETTMGAAHGVKTFELTNKYRAFIPYYRPIHPKTGENWENVGVRPDIIITEEKAKDKAIKLIQAKNE